MPKHKLPDRKNTLALYQAVTKHFFHFCPWSIARLFIGTWHTLAITQNMGVSYASFGVSQGWEESHILFSLDSLQPLLLLDFLILVNFPAVHNHYTNLFMLWCYQFPPNDLGPKYTVIFITQDVTCTFIGIITIVNIYVIHNYNLSNYRLSLNLYNLKHK